MGERRTGERRTGEIPAVGQPPAEQRQSKDRREEDRRDSPRIPIKLWVREPKVGGSFAERQGDIAVGGLYFVDNHSPLGSTVEVRFSLPNYEKEIRCKGELLRVEPKDDGRYGAHLKFVGLTVDQELAVARFVDDFIEETGKFRAVSDPDHKG
jgi:PilZ domain-containing protein